MTSDCLNRSTASLDDRRKRVSRYAAAAKVAAAIPAAVIASSADATIYSQTGLSLTVGSAQTALRTAQITGAGGAVVGTLSAQRAVSGYASFANIKIANGGVPGFASFRTVVQSILTTYWSGGLPVNANATWNNPGRALGEFIAGKSFGLRGHGDINFGTSSALPGSLNSDPQRVGNTGQTWYLLFRFNGGAASGNYGWLSFNANVGGYGNSSITITGWGWDDSGATIGAGVTASAIPGGTGLAALAFGAAGLRGRRRSRAA